MRNFILIVYALLLFVTQKSSGSNFQQDTAQFFQTTVIDSNYLKRLRETPRLKKDTIKLMVGTANLRGGNNLSINSIETPSSNEGLSTGNGGSLAMSSTASLVAGAVEGNLDVSPTGGATYTIPIKLPPGLNGVMPQLALSYNSQGGNGVAGYGWNISGLSAITRIHSTLFHDDYIYPVNYDYSDRFALDGQRLILKNGSYYGDANTEYVTENASNIRVFLKSGAQGLYFEVWYPDGSKALYGECSSSKTADLFAISSAWNLNNASMQYNYIKSNEALYISSITYGGLRNQSNPPNIVNFTYAAATAKEVSYTSSVSVFDGQNSQ